MFRSSLFLKTFSTIVFGVIIMAVIFYIFTVPMINSMAFEMEERAGQTVLDNMFLLIEQSHTDLESWRDSATKGHKRELKNIINVVESYIREVQRDIASKQISLEAGQHNVLERIRTLKYGNNDYIWVSDYSSRLISHPDPKLNNSDFSSVKDVNGDLIVPPMVEGALTKSEGYYSYWWRRLGSKEPVEKLTYYRNMPEWKWVLGTGVYIDDITDAYQKRKNELILELRNHLHTIKIAGEGYLYLFDSDMNMIIHPNANIEGTNFSNLLDPITQKSIARELMAVATTKEKKLDYKWDKPSDPGNYVYDKISWIRHIEDTDWYICSSVYTDDLKRSANALTNRIVLVSIVALILSITGGYFFVRAFTSPIKRLAFLANRISLGDLTTTANFNRKDEIGTLADAFNNMVDQLSDQIKNLEARVDERTSELSGWVGKLEQRNQEIETINSMGDMLQACRTHGEIYVVIAKSMKSLFPDSTGNLLMCDEHGKVLESSVRWNGGIVTDAGGFHELSDCWSFRRGKTYVMNDSNLHQVCRHIEETQEKVSPYLCVPMIAQGEIMGVLHVRPQNIDPQSPRQEIDEGVRRLAETVAEHAGLSLANLKLQHTLHEQSIRDVLTGLHNRRYAEELFLREQHRAARHGISIGFIVLDVDHFKRVNDTYGHEAGDEVLRRLGALLLREFRKEDTACRYGGEEFLVILPYAEREATRARAETLRLLIQQELTIPWQDEMLEITVSIGVALFPEQGNTIQQVVEAADAALYTAKNRGRNRVVLA
ncbi:MAG: cache domain-containing protein [Desulfuromonadaceae bacterium]